MLDAVLVQQTANGAAGAAAAEVSVLFTYPT